MSYIKLYLKFKLTYNDEDTAMLNEEWIKLQTFQKKLNELTLYYNCKRDNNIIYLETFTYNYPTILVWDPYFWELSEEVEDSFVMLKEVGILHNNAQEAAEHLSQIWDDLEEWWFSAEVQKSVRLFCNKFVRDDGQTFNKLLKEFKTSTQTY